MDYSLSLVSFTVFGQLAAGLALMIWLAGLQATPKREKVAWIIVLIAGIIAMVTSVTHLANPFNAPYTLTQVGHAWLSREIIAIAVFGLAVLLRLVNILKAGANPLIALLAIIYVVVMAQIYAQNDVMPFWDGIGTQFAFLGTMLLLGGAGAICLGGDTLSSKGLRISISAIFLGALATVSIFLFWLKSMRAGLDTMLLETLTSISYCMGGTMFVAFAVGGILLIWGAGRKSALSWLGWILLLGGALVGRALYYAAGIKLGF